MDKLERKLAHKEGELDMLQIANEALQAQAKVRRRSHDTHDVNRFRSLLSIRSRRRHTSTQPTPSERFIISP